MRCIYLTEPIHADAVTLLQDNGCEVIAGWVLDAAGQAQAMRRAEAVVTRIANLSAEVLGRMPALKLISKHGVGVDSIDLGVAAARGIVVANTPGANAASVAEHSLMMLLALARQAVAMDRVTRAGFAGREALAPVDIAGRRALVLGFGAIGQRVARLYAAMGMEVTVWHRRLTSDEVGFPVVRDLRTALPQAQVLSIHLPLNNGTRGLISGPELALLPEGAFVINTGRGGVADEGALADAAPRLGGIGVDVFEVEPIAPDNPLLSAPNTLLSPHGAALSPQGFRSMGMMATQNILDFADRKLNPAHRVDLSVYAPSSEQKVGD